MTKRLEEIKALPDGDLQQLISKTDEDGRSMLHAAAGSGHTELVTFLLSKGAAKVINNTDDESAQAMMRYANYSWTRAQTPTLRLPVASKGRAALLRLLIQKGAKINAKDCTGSTALHRASSAGKAEAVRFLVEEAHAPLEARDNAGETPLFVAAASGEKDIAIYLISKGADVEAENKDGENPLSEAARHQGMRDAMVAVAKGEMEVDV